MNTPPGNLTLPGDFDYGNKRRRNAVSPIPWSMACTPEALTWVRNIRWYLLNNEGRTPGQIELRERELIQVRWPWLRKAGLPADPKVERSKVRHAIESVADDSEKCDAIRGFVERDGGAQSVIQQIERSLLAELDESWLNTFCAVKEYFDQGPDARQWSTEQNLRFIYFRSLEEWRSPGVKTAR